MRRQGGFSVRGLALAARRFACAAVVGVLALGGCGGRSSSAGGSAAARSTAATTPSGPPSACTPQVRAATARLLRVAPSLVAASATTSSTAAPECDLKVGRLARLTAIVDSAPQAYFRLERAVVEEGQQFGNVRTAVPPQTVPGLGLDADWFPDRTELMTTDGARLISVTVSWPGAKESRARAVAEALARTYLSPVHG